MSGSTSIEWTDRTWNPVRGCSRVSEGCRNCYAEKVAARFSGAGLAYEGLTTAGKWNGRIYLVDEALTLPLRWRKPSRIFVNSMSDLFHDNVPDEWLDRVFAVMALATWHTLQVLTKRPERMREYLGQPDVIDRWAEAMKQCEHANAWPDLPGRWPLPNVWLGVSVEDQATADARIPLLLQTPAALRFVSYEPALGPVDFGLLQNPVGQRMLRWHRPVRDSLHWIIVGGESGPEARPFHVAWARSTVEQCARADVSCFVKQLGPFPAVDQIPSEGDLPHGCGLLPDGTTYSVSRGDNGLWDFAAGADGWKRVKVPRNGALLRRRLHDRKGGDMAEWPEDLRVREFPR